MRRIVSVFALLALLFLLAGCAGNTASVSNGLLETEISFVGFATEKDFDTYNCVEFEFADTPAGYKVYKLNCVIKNNASFPVAYIEVKPFENDSVKCVQCALDYEPTMPLHSGEEYDCDLYIYVKDGLNEEQIKEQVNSITFEFDGGKVDDN